jgi:hypothetical protein
MRGNGVVLGILFLFILCQLPLEVNAGRTGYTPTWSSGLQIDIDIENNDYWKTGSISEIFFTLTLLSAGPVVDFKTLIFDITVVTEINYTGQLVVNDPWNIVGDETRIVGRFNIQSQDVNNAGWDIYMAEFYYNFSVIVDTDSYTNFRFYTHQRQGTPLNISTFSFIILWPFPPIILMMCVYWILYLGLKKFNKRYEGLEEKPSNP